MTDDDRLSQMSTQWTLLARAHAGGGDAARQAQGELLPRYCPVVFRYLRGVVRDAAAAEELCQEFAFRFVRGDFRHARPERGRFRDYLKASLLHLVGEHRRRARPDRAVPLADGDVPAPEPEDRGELQELWRRGLLDRAWAALEEDSRAGGGMHYHALRFKAEGPMRRSADVAAALAERFGRPVAAANARQVLHRARERFAELLRREVAASLPGGGPADVDAELADLGLLAYCKKGG